MLETQQRRVHRRGGDVERVQRFLLRRAGDHPEVTGLAAVEPVEQGTRVRREAAGVERRVHGDRHGQQDAGDRGMDAGGEHRLRGQAGVFGVVGEEAAAEEELVPVEVWKQPFAAAGREPFAG